MMKGLMLATCEVTLSKGGPLPKEADAPEWVHLFPNGHMKSRDGREFDLADLPIDYEHQADKPEAQLKGPVPAAGWIKALAANESGLWGQVEWTATARAMIRSKEYRYLSPSFYHNTAGQIMRLNGAGLVHRPGLHLKALASEEDTMPPNIPPAKADAPPAKPDAQPSFIQRLAEMLGLGPDATEDEVMDALAPKLATAREATPDPRKYVPAHAVAELLSDRNSRISIMQEAQASAMVEKAFDEGYLTPAMRGWATALVNEDPESFRTFLAKAPRPFADFFKPVNRYQPGRTGDVDQSHDSDEAAAICSQLGLKPGAPNG
jgi:phage I-like protein